MRNLGTFSTAIFLLSCSSGGDGTAHECARVSDWREPIEMFDGIVEVPITDACSGDLTITFADLEGAGFEADLPEVGDVVVGDDYSIEVRFSSVSPNPGEYQASLTIEADGLMYQPPKQIIYVYEGE